MERNARLKMAECSAAVGGSKDRDGDRDPS